MDGQQRILSMWAYIALDADGTEGVVAAEIDGMMLPLAGADLARIASFRPLAVDIANQFGITITLVHFSTRTDAEVITPDPSPSRT